MSRPPARAAHGDVHASSAASAFQPVGATAAAGRPHSSRRCSAGAATTAATHLGHGVQTAYFLTAGRLQARRRRALVLECAPSYYRAPTPERAEHTSATFSSRASEDGGENRGDRPLRRRGAGSALALVVPHRGRTTSRPGSSRREPPRSERAMTPWREALEASPGQSCSTPTTESCSMRSPSAALRNQGRRATLLRRRLSSGLVAAAGGAQKRLPIQSLGPVKVTRRNERRLPRAASSSGPTKLERIEAEIGAREQRGAARQNCPTTGRNRDPRRAQARSGRDSSPAFTLEEAFDDR